MRRFWVATVVALAFAMAAAGSAAAQDEDTFSSWNTIQLKKSWERMYATTRLENRTGDCFIVRQYVGCKVMPWLKFDVAYDYIAEHDGAVKQRALASLTGTLKQGPLSVSVRERYVISFNRPDGSAEWDAPTSVLRSKLTAKYAIPDSRFAPYLAVELFTWEKWKKTRHYAGTEIRIDEHNALDLFYMYYTFVGKSYAQHTLGAGWSLSF